MDNTHEFAVHLGALNAAVHVLLATTCTPMALALLDKTLQQYEAELLASVTSDAAVQRLSEWTRTLLDAGAQGCRIATSRRS